MINAKEIKKTTVSPFRKETRIPSFHCGVENNLISRRDDFQG